MYQPPLPPPLSIPPPPPMTDSQPLTSATYIPHGESFGPGVGIPSLHSFGREPSSTSGSRLGMGPNGSNGTLRNGPETTITNTPQDSTRPTHLNYPIMSHHQSSSSPAGYVAAGHTTVRRTSNGRLSGGSASDLLLPTPVPNPWTLDRVLAWLASNDFSRDWQETFKFLVVQGDNFLELGRGHGGRGNFGMMHQLIYPQLAKECTRSGSGWDQGREREEGKRMRRLIRRIGNSTPADNARVGAPDRTNNDLGTEGYSSLTEQELVVNTPSTAGGEDSPGRHLPLRLPGPGVGARRMSNQRSSTVPTLANAGLDSNGMEAGQMQTNPRTGYRTALGEGSRIRHSPSTSNDASLGGGYYRPGSRGDLRTDGSRPSNIEASPSSDGPHYPAPLSASTAAAHLSSSPHSHGFRFDHHKSNSTDSMASSPGLSAGGSTLRSGYGDGMLGRKTDESRRNAQDGVRPAIPADNKIPFDMSTPVKEKEPSRGLLSKLRWRNKKDEGSQASPEDNALESPTSPVNARIPSYMDAGMGLPPFARPGMNNSDPTLDRPSSASAMLEQDRWAMGSRRQASTRRSPARRYVMATPDGWNYRLVDITDAESAQELRELIYSNLGVPDGDLATLYLTEPGRTDHNDSLSDAKLIQSRHLHADSRASLKVFVRSPSLAAASFNAPRLGSTRSQEQASPGSTTESLSLDESTPARLPSQKSRSSYTFDRTSRADTIRAHSALSRETPRSLSEMSRDRRRSGEIPMWGTLHAPPVSAHPDSSEPEGGSWLPMDLGNAAAEYRRETDRKGQAYLVSKQAKLRQDSPVEEDQLGIRGDRIIDFDIPRISPFEDKKQQDSWIPQRKPPPPPAESNTLIKANSLSKDRKGSRRLSGAEADEHRRSSDLAQESLPRTVASDASNQGSRNPIMARPRPSREERPTLGGNLPRDAPSRRSYGPDFDFQDNNVTFERSPVLPASKAESD